MRVHMLSGPFLLNIIGPCHFVLGVSLKVNEAKAKALSIPTRLLPSGLPLGGLCPSWCLVILKPEKNGLEESAHVIKGMQV